MTSKSVFIATPTYDEWLAKEHCTSLFETGILLSQAGYSVSYAVLSGNPFLDLARNELVEKFLASDADDLLFIDADVGWDAKAVTRVLSHKQEIVGGLVPKRDQTNDSSFHQNALTGVMQGCLMEAKEIPTAFLKINRAVFEKLERPYFKIGDNAKDFGEDIYFCRKAVKAGFSMWIDSDISFSHRGGKAWKGNFFDHCVKSGLLQTEQAA